jgi:hypothetical protein
MEVKPFDKAEAEAIVYFLKENVPADLVPRIRGLLTGSEVAEDDEASELADRLNSSYGADGRRIVRPASPAAKKAFDEQHGLSTKRIRVLG